MSKEDTFSRTPEKIDQRIKELEKKYSKAYIRRLGKRFTAEQIVAFLEIAEEHSAHSYEDDITNIDAEVIIR